MRTTTTIKLSDSLELEIEGKYTTEEPMVWNLPNGDPGYPGSASEFETQDIKIIKGNLCDFIDYLDGKKDLWEHLTELVINKIEER